MIPNLNYQEKYWERYLERHLEERLEEHLEVPFKNQELEAYLESDFKLPL
jgi:hypothetical protein